jgi:hypothetical protein
VSRVQRYGWLGRGRTGLAAAQSDSIWVHVKQCAARRVGSARVQGMGCVASGARCHARAWVERRERSCVRAGTRTPVSASPSVVERGQSEARAWPMRGLGGRG